MRKMIIGVVTIGLLGLAVTFAATSRSSAAPATVQPRMTKKAAIQAGQAVFERHCAICHASGPLHPGTTMLQRRTEGNDAVLTMRKGGVPADYVKQVVRNGLIEMPPFSRNDISDPELAALAQYLEKHR